MSLPQKLKTLRAEHNMTQAELGRQINVARATIAGYETRNRQPSYEKLTAIAETFPVSVDYRLDSTEEPIVLQSMPEADRMLDRQIFQVYRTLSLAEKEDAYEYLCFLKQREQKH